MYEKCPSCIKKGTNICGNDPDCSCYEPDDFDDYDDYSEDDLVE